eukprot:TRINITY_DN646_c0_g2_i1.p1 TRINITY_DN646_c0_g2~~TRINITY_DN646_c0_g2_i1.p1  ORF type:complete len:586 (-),score=138.09 TRINITY_DN646_c0_g2_i1:322-2079(-)
MTGRPLAKVVTPSQICQHALALDWQRLPADVYGTPIMPIGPASPPQCRLISPSAPQEPAALLAVLYAARHSAALATAAYPFPPPFSHTLAALPVAGALQIMQWHSGSGGKLASQMLAATVVRCPEVLRTHEALHDSFETDWTGSSHQQAQPFYQWANHERNRTWVDSLLEPASLLRTADLASRGGLQSVITILDALRTCALDQLIGAGERALRALLPLACQQAVAPPLKGSMPLQQAKLSAVAVQAWRRWRRHCPWSHRADALLADAALNTSTLSRIKIGAMVKEPLLLLRAPAELFKSSSWGKALVAVVTAAMAAARTAASEAARRSRNQADLRVLTAGSGVPSAPSSKKARRDDSGTAGTAEDEEGTTGQVRSSIASSAAAVAGPSGAVFLHMQALIAVRCLLVLASMPDTPVALRTHACAVTQELMVEMPALFKLLLRHPMPQQSVELLMKGVPPCAAHGADLCELLDLLVGEPRMYGVMVVSAFLRWHRPADTIATATKALHAVAIIAGIVPAGSGATPPLDARLLQAALPHARAICAAVPAVIPTGLSVLHGARRTAAGRKRLLEYIAATYKDIDARGGQ